MKPQPFACMVIHGPARFSRRRKKQFKRNYLHIVAKVTESNMRKDGVPFSPRALWRHCRGLRVEMSFVPPAPVWERWANAARALSAVCDRSAP